MKLAITGRMCSGKTTLSNTIQEIEPRFQIFSFGKKVKEVATDLFGMDPLTKDRTLLINFANKMREIDSNVWINQVLKETRGNKDCIIDDVRYQNEVDALLKDGWHFIQLHIPT